MQYKFVRKWSGMVLYIRDWYFDSLPPTGKIYYWRKATDDEAYKLMCELNKD